MNQPRVQIMLRDILFGIIYVSFTLNLLVNWNGENDVCDLDYKFYLILIYLVIINIVFHIYKIEQF